MVIINPLTERLQAIVKQQGAHGWVVLRNVTSCPERGNKPASLVCKDNKMIWLTTEEIKNEY